MCYYIVNNFYRWYIDNYANVADAWDMWAPSLGAATGKFDPNRQTDKITSWIKPCKYFL